MRGSATSLLKYVLLSLTIIEAIGVALGSIGVAKIASLIGKSSFYLVIGLLIYCLYSGRTGSFIIGGLGLTASADIMLKTTLKMPRPPSYLWLMNAEGPGFPSGHAAMSTAFAVLVTYCTRDPILAAALGIHAGAVSISRIVLNVHYPIDVFGGIVIGIIGALAAIALYTASKNIGKYLVLIGLPSLLMSIVSMYEMPEYTDSPLILGVSLGLIVSGPLLDKAFREQCLVDKRFKIRILSLILGFIGLVIVLGLKSTDTAFLTMLGGLIYVVVALCSRPIACRIFK